MTITDETKEKVEGAIKATMETINNLKTLFTQLITPEDTRPITERIKSYEDACAVQGLDPVAELPYANPQNIEEEVANKTKMLRIIAKGLKQDYVPNWNDGSLKWRPWFNMGSSGSGFSRSNYGHSSSFTCCGSRLCFPTEALSDYFGKQFEDLHMFVLRAE